MKGGSWWPPMVVGDGGGVSKVGDGGGVSKEIF